MATQGNVGVGQNIREMTALGDAILFEIYRQGIAAGYATFQEVVLPDWDRWFASRLPHGRPVVEKEGWVVC